MTKVFDIYVNGALWAQSIEYEGEQTAEGLRLALLPYKYEENGEADVIKAIEHGASVEFRGYYI